RFLVAAWAAQRSGLYFTPISTQLGAAEVRYILSDSGASVLIASARTAAVAADAAAGLDAPLRLRLLADEPADGPPPGFVSWDDVVAGQAGEPLADETEGADMVYSSGTTGRPKGIKRPLSGQRFGTPPRRLAAMVALHGGAPCPVEVKRQMMGWWGPILHEFYGGSEGAAFVACGPEEWLARPGTVGRSLRGRIHVLAEDGSELPSGEIGEIWFEGGQ